MKSHDQPDCLFWDVEGWVKTGTNNSNISDESYLAAFHDTGAIPRSNLKDKPKGLQNDSTNRNNRRKI